MRKLPEDVAALCSESAFTESILESILLSGDVYADGENIDVSYPAPGYGIDPADSVRPRVAYLEFFLENSTRLYRTFTALEDPASKEMFCSLILFRILGYRRVRIPIDHERYFAYRREASARPARPSVLAAAPIQHFEVEHERRTFALDCLTTNIFFSFHLKQYYFDRNGVTIAPRAGDVIIDAGACYGDTALEFAHRAGPAGHVYTLEVLPSNQDLTEANIRQNADLTNITLIRCALGSSDGTGSWPEGSLNPGYQVQGTEPMRSLDSLVADGTIPRVDFLKMDIEGAELDALRGAVNTIQRFRPRLAISIYHRPEDYYSIAEVIRDLAPGCRFYLDNYTISDGETILYAACEAA